MRWACLGPPTKSRRSSCAWPRCRSCEATLRLQLLHALGDPEFFGPAALAIRDALKAVEAKERAGAGALHMVRNSKLEIRVAQGPLFGPAVRPKVHEKLQGLVAQGPLSGPAVLQRCREKPQDRKAGPALRRQKLMVHVTASVSLVCMLTAVKVFSKQSVPALEALSMPAFCADCAPVAVKVYESV